MDKRLLHRLHTALPFLAATLAYLISYARDPRRPAAADLAQGWWTFSDQGRYLRSTLAWAVGNLDPAQHWYLPGYPLLAVPFVHLTRANPFLLPDLLFLLASLWLTGALAARLAPAWRHARLAGLLAFLGTSVLPPAVLNVWVTPWTSTPQTAATLGCLLATLMVLEQPGAATVWRRVLAAALCAGAIAAFRPADAVTVSLVCGGAMLLRTATAWPGRAAVLRLVAAGLLGGLVPVAVLLALHLLVHGWQLGEYLSYSAYLGFEWRILPLQWVTLMLDPRPLMAEGPGLIARLPWIVPGLAGMVACLVSPPLGGRRGPHALVVTLAVALVLQYLAYRDLHPQGLWRYYNFHYFKWVLPVFGLYAVLLCAAAAQRRWAGVAAGVVAATVLLPWRAELVMLDGPALPPQAGRTVALPGGLGVWDAVLIPADGTFETIYHGTHNYYFGENDRIWYGGTGRITAYAVPNGVMLTPLLTLPMEPGKVVFDAGTLARGSTPPRLARQRIVLGAPCFLSSRRWPLAGCAAPTLIPPPGPGAAP